MANLFLNIYDWLCQHRKSAVLMVLFMLLFCIVSLSRLHYEEDISSFLPIDSRDSMQTDIMERLNRENSVAVIFRDNGTGAGSSDERVTEAMDLYEELWFEADTLGLVPYLSAIADESMAFELIEFVQEHYASFVTEDDYRRMDSLLCIPGFVENRLEQSKRSLQTLGGSFTAQTIPYDPLGLFGDILLRLSQSGTTTGYRMVEGHIMHKEEPVGFLFFESPFGNSESGQNALLKELSEQVAASCTQMTGVRVSVVGAPIIAVTNAQRIKLDSILAVVLAVIGILAVLWFSFKRVDCILWIAATLLFGAIFSLGIIGVIKDSISIIVIGLGSVIVGIAANYPLHFLHSLCTTADNRRSLGEMVVPLLVGNITTVSAFLCLLFLKAQAMHDLALFGSFMLVGTILFTLLFLPVWARPAAKVSQDDVKAHDEPHSHAKGIKLVRWVSPMVILVTVVMLVIGESAGFDTNLNHINYMTEQQKEDLALLQGGSDAVSMDGLSLIAGMLGPTEEKEAAAARWVEFWQRYEAQVSELESLSLQMGFSAGAFQPFLESVRSTPQIVSCEDVAPQSMGAVMQSLIESLSNDFNTILFLCGFIVFVFLWISFGSIELALLAFLPLTVGWVWILSIMNMLGIDFNIVSIILATFIFGQGDDYTIFITEGLMQEYASGRRTLGDRRKSVVISAVIMFIGIGTLILAQHPAMRSLAEITILGMAVVVVMAQFLPEWIFRWLTVKSGTPREVPVTIARLGRTLYAFMVLIIAVLVVTPVAFVLFLGPKRDWKDRWLHGVLYRFSNFVIRRVPAVKFTLDNSVGEGFEKPAVIISNHQSHLDLMCLLMLTPKMVVVTNDWVWRNPIYGPLIRRAEFIPAAEGVERYLPQLKSLVSRGYSILVFPEGTRSNDSAILRFHKGAFHIASELGLDIVPVLLHGVGQVLPKREFMLRPGHITVTVGHRITRDSGMWSVDSRELTRNIHRYYLEWYDNVCSKCQDVAYWMPLVRLQFKYKGLDVEMEARNTLRTIARNSHGIECVSTVGGSIEMEENGLGERSLLMALTHPKTAIYSHINNKERYMVARSCSMIPSNLQFILDGE